MGVALRGLRAGVAQQFPDLFQPISVGQVVDGPDRIHGGSIALPRLFGKVQAALTRGEDVLLTVHPAAELG